jgi:asparagine synthase (glutamine-hydrolysing)
LAAYRHAGLRGLAWLEGEFALVVWDAARRCLIGQRDPLGSWPLFWTKQGTAVGLGTRPRSLAARPGRPGAEYEPAYIAEYLMWPSAAVEPVTERSAFKGVWRVAPGTIVELKPGDNVTSHRYWDWGSRINPLAGAAIEDMADRLLALLRDAVAERIRSGRVAAHLSGGMDSSTIVCLARDLIAEGVGPAPLATVSLVYEGRGLAGERAYIDSVVGQGGPIVPIFLRADDALDYRWFEREIPEHDEPFSGLIHLEMERLPLEAAERAGATSILTGLGSDEILDGQPFHLADWIRRCRWGAALREAIAWARAGDKGFGSTLVQFGLEPLLSIALRDGLLSRLRQGYGRWPGLGRFTIPPWIHPEFASRHGMRELGIANARRMYQSPTPRSLDLTMIATSVGDWARWHLAAPRGLTITHPFRDARVMTFGLSLPLHMKATPDRRKPVLQESTRGLLPEEIRMRAEKCSFNDVYWLGLAKSLPQLEELVVDSALGEMGLIDPDRLIDVMRQAALGVGDVIACDHMDRTLALVAWHNRLRSSLPNEWPCLGEESR